MRVEQVFMLLAAVGLSFGVLPWRKSRERRQEAPGREQHENVTSASEERFRSLVHNTSDIITILEADGTVRYLSTAVERTLGYRPEELVGTRIFGLVHPDDVERALGLFAEILARPGVHPPFEFRVPHKDGSWRYLEHIVNNLLDDPAANAVVVNSRDITERKRAEEALREAEAKYRTLVEQLPAITYVNTHARGNDKLYVSPQIESILGVTVAEWTSDPQFWVTLLHPEDRERVVAEVARSYETGEPLATEYRMIARDGRVVWFRDEAMPVRDDAGQFYSHHGVMLDVTERKEAEKRLRDTEARYRTLVESIPAITYMQDIGDTSHSVYISPQVEEILGYSPEECTSDPEHWIKVIHPADRKRVLAEDRRTNETGEPFSMEYRQLAKDGRVVWVRDEGTLVRDEEGNPRYWLGVQMDITNQKRAEEALRESELRLRSVIANVPVVLFALDLAGMFTLSEGKGLEALGLEPGEIVGRSVSEVFGDRQEILDDIDRALAGEEFSVVRKAGTRTFEMWYAPVRARTGEVSGVIGVATDITEHKELEEQLAHLAFYDPLTKLPNRASFMEHLKRALDRADDERDYTAVITLNLDNFRVVNDSLGHEAGDRLLVAVAERLQRCLSPGDTIARLSGDGFVVLLEDIRGTREAVRVAERLEESLRAPVALSEQEVSITASIGIALAGTSEEQPEALLRNADTAMYWAKDRGKAQYEIFDPSMDTRASERLVLEQELRLAVEHGRLSLRYQPDILLDSGDVVGMNASVYWEHPARGLMRPSEFISVAEGTLLILSIGHWALREACRQTARWQERHTSDLPLMICVDLFARQFRQKDLTKKVASLLRETGLEPRALNLRISESVAMKDAHYTISTLEELKSLGVQLSISSFGTGYSSLRYLNRFPVDFLVIDSSFVGNLWEASADATVVSGMISLAHALGITAVAEGVETPQQVAQLRRLGCNLAQGDYFSEPLTSEAAAEFLATTYGRQKAD